jgi:calcineurin-like phosphoesterase family protein
MKLKTDRVWFTSDTHYGHQNIVRGETRWRDETGAIPLNNVRDFDSLIEMNQSLVKGINLHVEPSDWLIHLGDWSFGGCPRIKEFREQINCNNIVLILGNHDQHIQRDSGGGPFRSLFHRAESYLEVFYSAGNHNSRIILCHYPISSWNEMHYGSYMLHGHQHLKGDSRFGIGRTMDVGACGTFSEGKFRPYHIDEIFGLLENRSSETPLY